MAQNTMTKTVAEFTPEELLDIAASNPPTTVASILLRFQVALQEVQGANAILDRTAQILRAEIDAALELIQRGGPIDADELRSAMWKASEAVHKRLH